MLIEIPPYTISQGIQDGLRARKHNITVSEDFAAVQAVVRNEDEEIYGKSDPRKYGWPAGFWTRTISSFRHHKTLLQSNLFQPKDFWAEILRWRNFIFPQVQKK